MAVPLLLCIILIPNRLTCINNQAGSTTCKESTFYHYEGANNSNPVASMPHSNKILYMIKDELH